MRDAGGRRRPRHAWTGLVGASLAAATILGALALGPEIGRFVPGYATGLADGTVISLGAGSAVAAAEPGAVAGVDGRADGLTLVSLSDPMPLDPAAPYVAGVTWEGEAVVAVEARYFRVGAWSEWEALGIDDVAGEQPGTESRFGTEPFVVDGTDAIQVRAFAADGRPADLSVRVFTSAVASGDLDLALSAGGLGTSAPLPADLARADGETPVEDYLPETSRLYDIPQPPVHARAEWTDRLPTVWFQKSEVIGAAVHHTAGTNTYSRAEVPSILRSILRLHMDGRGFWDMAYNFLIDKYGGIWEGRAGGIAEPARGAHSHTFNPIVTGVSLMGDFQQVGVPAAALDSLVSLLAWKLTLHGASADGILLHEGTWPAIIGHKDIPESSTACPGKNLYALLPEIRARVKAAQHLAPAPYSADVTGDGLADFAVATSTGIDVRTTGLLASPLAPFQGQEHVASLATEYDLVTSGPSLVGGPGTDILARQASTGFVVRIPLLPDGTLGEQGVVGFAPSIDRIVSPGDVTGDGIRDLVVANLSSGVLAVLRGTGAGGVGPPELVATPYGELRGLGAAGDVTGDGIPDLALILDHSGTLAIAPGDGAGGFGALRSLGSGWQRFDQVSQAGDLTGDGVPDLVVRGSRNGRARTLVGGPGGPTGAYLEWSAAPATWGDPMPGIGLADAGVVLLALDPSSGAVVRPTPVIAARDTDDLQRTIDGTGFRNAAVVGDVDHNGFADVVALGPGGVLSLYLATADGFERPVSVTDPNDRTYLEYVPNDSFFIPPDLPVSLPFWIVGPPAEGPTPANAAPFWSEYTQVGAAGDMDFDGTPDLVAITAAGDVWVYPMNAETPSLPDRGLKIARGLIGYSIAGVGPWRSSSVTDLVAISPTGDVRILTGEGLSGARVGPAVSSGWASGTIAQGVGAIDVSGLGGVAMIDPVSGEVRYFRWEPGNDWARLDLAAD